MKVASIKKNAFVNFLKNFVSTLFPIISFSYVSKILGPEILGRIDFVISIISYFVILASLGIDNYGAREVAKLRDDKLALSQFVKELFLINVISTFVSYLLLSIFLFFNKFLVDYHKLLIIQSITILFTTLGMNWFFVGVENFTFIMKRTVVFQILSFIFLLFFVREKTDYIKYASILVFSSVGSNVLNFIYIRKAIVLKTNIKISLQKHLKPIFILFSMSVAVRIYTVLDTTMLGIIQGEFEVGVYAVATKINKTILFLIVSISSVLLPRLSYYTTSNKEEFSALVTKGIDFLLLISLPCIAGLCILAKPIIFLFSGNAYEVAITPMRIMNPIILIIGLSNFIGVQIFMPLGKEKYTLISVLTGAVSNFLLNLILIKKLGVVGVSIATVISETIVTVIQIMFSIKILPWKFILSRFLLYSFNTLIMSAISILVFLNINNIFLQLVIVTLSGVFTYFILLLIQKNKFLLSMNILKRRK